jgi:RNA polymerase sigma-70 factor, ECF subfamily
LATKQRVTQPAGEDRGLEEQAKLVEQFCSGDRSALAALVRIWEHRLLTIAYRVVGNLQDAEEVRQAVLVKLVQLSTGLPDPSRFAGWMRRCVVNEAIDWLRRRSETHRTERFDDTIACRSSSPAQQAMAAERLQRLRQALRQLDPDLRALVSLRFDEGLTIREIAEVVEKPPMTVHSQITRAVGQLRQLLASDCDSEARL